MVEMEERGVHYSRQQRFLTHPGSAEQVTPGHGIIEEGTLFIRYRIWKKEKSETQWISYERDSNSGVIFMSKL